MLDRKWNSEWEWFHVGKDISGGRDGSSFFDVHALHRLLVFLNNLSSFLYPLGFFELLIECVAFVNIFLLIFSPSLFYIRFLILDENIIFK